MIDLPDWPLPNGADLSLLDFGSMLTPALGGPVQRVNRMGSRFRGTFTLPPLTSDKVGRVWVRRLVQGKFEGVRMPLPLLDFKPGSPGIVKVNGSGQSGTTLNVKGATPSYAFREGQPFSIETGGKHHLYMVAEETIAGSTGLASVPVTPMLRRPHLDNDLCHFAQPMFEGFIGGDEIGWNLSVERLISLQFDITESQ